VPPGADEGLLGDLLGGVPVSDDHQGQPEHPPLEAPDEDRGGFGVAGGHPGQ
jgi:hypothetical protein